MSSLMESAGFEVKPDLINKNASDNAKRLMAYLCDIYGKHMLTGQQIGVTTTPEFEFIRRETGKYPAVGGFDLMEYSPSRVERGSLRRDVDLALEWWKDGGIVTFCWHWNAPKDLIDLPPDKHWSSGFYTKATTFDVAKAMDDPASEEYSLLIRDIDAAAAELQRLQEAGVPVLWRPLHEASGAWFWWGAKGAEPCVQLWKLMYERMTNHHKLNHLIWVWNGQHKDWYPGDEFVDIIGEDIYPPEQDSGSQIKRFHQAQSYTSMNKIITLSENGPLPDPDNLIRDGAPWAWNCTWYGGFLYKKEGDQLVFSDQYTARDIFSKIYDHPFTLTRDELPNLADYRLP